MILYNLSSNKESGAGRYDICLTPINKTNPGVIIEIKKSSTKEGSEENALIEALDQIKKNEYTFQLSQEGVNEILLISILFNKMNPFLKYAVLKN